MRSVWPLAAAFAVLVAVSVLEPRFTVFAGVLAVALFVGWLILRNRARRLGVELSSPWSNIPVVPGGVISVGSGGHDSSSSQSSSGDGGVSCGTGTDGGGGSCQ